MSESTGFSEYLAKGNYSLGNWRRGDSLLWIAGPCSVESRSQLLSTARALRDIGVTALRGGAFKTRTSPYSFQGLGEKAIDLLFMALYSGG
jgi:3-deoxy-7-phosphoheptulonate synthase